MYIHTMTITNRAIFDPIAGEPLDFMSGGGGGGEQGIHKQNMVIHTT